MKKIAILSAVNIKHMSLISLYTSYLEEQKIPYDIIYMDKYDEVEEINAKNIFRFVNPINHNWSRIKKIIRYLKFVGYAKKVINKEKYDYLIVWNDVAISMFGLYLARKWKNKYCLNIRDYNGEKKWYVYRIFDRAIKNSSFTTISSEGFRSFLPEYDYISLYSYNSTLLKDAIPQNKKRDNNERIRISFIGNVRFFEENKKLIQAFKNDSRFELIFNGTNADVLAEYAKEINATNVYCTGSFPISMTTSYLNKADIINNLFGDKTIGVRTLTSVRLFHAAYMNIPVLVNAGTYMQDITDKFGIGYSVESIDDNLPDKLYKWYHDVDFETIKHGCQKLLDEAEKSNELFIRKLNEFLLE